MLYHYPSDHGIFDQGLSRSTLNLSDEEREKRFTSLERCKDELAQLFEGDDAMLGLLWRFFDGEISCRELGDALGVDASTAWRRAQRQLVECRFVRAVQLATDAFRKNQGFTIDVRRGMHAPQVDSYAIALDAKRRRFAQGPTATEIRKFLRTHAKCLDKEHGPKHFFGGWIHAGFHLSVIRVIKDRSEAVEFAKDHDQQLVFDLKDWRGISESPSQQVAA